MDAQRGELRLARRRLNGEAVPDPSRLPKCGSVLGRPKRAKFYPLPTRQIEGLQVDSFRLSSRHVDGPDAKPSAPTLDVQPSVHERGDAHVAACADSIAEQRELDGKGLDRCGRRGKMGERRTPALLAAKNHNPDDPQTGSGADRQCREKGKPAQSGDHRHEDGYQPESSEGGTRLTAPPTKRGGWIVGKSSPYFPAHEAILARLLFYSMPMPMLVNQSFRTSRPVK